MSNEKQTSHLSLVPPLDTEPVAEVASGNDGLITMPDNVVPRQTADLKPVREIIDGGIPGIDEAPSQPKPQHDLASTALGGRFGTGTIPVENPGPQAIRQAASYGSLQQVGPATYSIPEKQDS